jgi:spore maturation protein SpmB
VFRGNAAFFHHFSTLSSLLSSTSSGKVFFWLLFVERVLRKCGLLSSLVNIIKPVINYFFRKNAFLINFRCCVLRKYILFLSYDRVLRKCGLLSSLINILKPVIKYFFRKNAFKIILVTVFEGNKAHFYLINISSL